MLSLLDQRLQLPGFVQFLYIGAAANELPIDEHSRDLKQKRTTTSAKRARLVGRHLLALHATFHTVVAPVSSPKTAWISAASSRDSSSMAVKAWLILLNCCCKHEPNEDQYVHCGFIWRQVKCIAYLFGHCAVWAISLREDNDFIPCNTIGNECHRHFGWFA